MEYIELTDEFGNKEKFEVLDVIYKDDEEYVVLGSQKEEGEVVICKVITLNDDKDESTYEEVEDEELADEIFNEFVKRVDGEE